MDVVLLTIVSWFGIIGWKRGSGRALTDAFTCMVSVFVMTKSMPILEPSFFGPAMSATMNRFVELHMNNNPPKSAFLLLHSYATPVSTTGALHVSIIANRIFDAFLTTMFASAVWIGLQLILNVHASIKKTQFSDRARRPLLGCIIGILLGGYVAVFLLRGLVLVCWFNNTRILDETIVHSVLAHVIGAAILPL